MKINVHAGHNADGKVACGAVGLIKESTEARKVKDEVIRQLRAMGHTVYDCTVDDAKSVLANLSGIVEKCNANSVDLDVSIHLNSGANDKTGNGKSCGTEVLIYSESSKAKSYAEATCKAIEELGFKNRGVKIRTNLYVLKHTNAPAMLIECCFVDDADDVKLYDYNSMARAIVRGITGCGQLVFVPIDNEQVQNEATQSGAGQSNQAESKVPYSVRITADSLRIRAGAGTNYKIKGVITDNQSLIKSNPNYYYKKTVYTIVEEKNGWGKLKSGIGYICLDYTKKV